MGKKKMTKAFRKTPAVPKRATGLPLPAAALGAQALLFGLRIWVGIVPAGLLRPRGGQGGSAVLGAVGVQLEVLIMGEPPQQPPCEGLGSILPAGSCPVSPRLFA